MVNEAKISKHAPTGFGPRARIGDNTGHLKRKLRRGGTEIPTVDECTSNHVMTRSKIAWNLAFTKTIKLTFNMTNLFMIFGKYNIF